MNNLSFIDVINILDYIIGLENLALNEKQVNNLDEHLKRQDDILVQEQNTMLKKIIEQNEIIINLLKGEKINAQNTN